jgi:hypothetical protein
MVMILRKESTNRTANVAVLLRRNIMADGTTMDGVAMAALLNNHIHHGYGNHGGWNGGREDWRTEQNQANMSLMQSIGQVDKSVAVSTASMEASQAAQSAGIVSQLNNVAGSLAARTDGVKDTINSLGMHLAEKISNVDKAVMENRYELSKDITADGEKTRTLVISQYEATLNRLLAEANAEIVELRSDSRSTRRAHDNEINVTQTVNQMQQQQQQTAQFNHLFGLLNDAVQNIRATNQAINIGGGTLTSTPTNTSTNSRVN